MNYIIGVDGGGTKTEAVAYGLDGNELGRGNSGFGNILLDFDQALHNIINSINLCKNRINRQDTQCKCLCIYLGLAGIETGGYRQKVEKLLQEEFNCKVEACNDAQLAHAALLKGKDGIMTISGTGSISYGLYKGKSDRTGGWGHILGDEGSGYFIALEAFKRMTLEEDLGLVRSELTKAIISKLNIDEVNDIKGFIYGASKGDIAAFTPLVVELAKASEVNCVSILKNAGIQLAIMTQRLYKKLGINGHISIGVKGSILNKVDIVMEEFKNYLENNLVGVTVIGDDVSPAKGAYYLYKISK